MLCLMTSTDLAAAALARSSLGAMVMTFLQRVPVFHTLHTGAIERQNPSLHTQVLACPQECQGSISQQQCAEDPGKQGSCARLQGMPAPCWAYRARATAGMRMAEPAQHAIMQMSCSS